MRETEASGSKNQSLIHWYNLLPDGRTRDKLVTYHDYAGGWYAVIPERRTSALAVNQSAAAGGGKLSTFLYLDGDSEQPLFTVITLPVAAAERLSDGHWTTLLQKGDTVVAVRQESGAKQYALTIETLRDMINAIPVDWKTGETD